MKSQTVTPLVFDTYISVIKNSVGSRLFKNFYARVDGKKKDIMKNGDLSCAFYVSSILVLLEFIKRIHGTVDATVKELEASGWRPIQKPKMGSVIVWERVEFGKNDIHKHIGFYVGNKIAISNSSHKKTPTKHHWTFNGKRKIEKILWNPKLNKH